MFRDTLECDEQTAIRICAYSRQNSLAVPVDELGYVSRQLKN